MMRRIGSRIAYGFRLGTKSIGVVWNDKTLLLFPLTSTACTLVAIFLIYIGVGPDKWHLVLNTEVNDRGVQLINWGYYVVVLIAYLGAAFLTVFFNVALIGATDISMSTRDSKFRDGFGIAVRNIPSIFIWSVVSSTLGVLLSILDRERHISRWLRKILGAPWSILTYFVVPVMVLEKRLVFTAFGRSVKIMDETWGERISAQFTLRWFLFLLNIPLLVAYIVAWFRMEQISDLLILLGLCYIAFTVVLAQTVKSVLTTVLYKYAARDEVPEGWNRDLLAEAFHREPDEDADEAEAPDLEPGENSDKPQN
jgi:hypothetical protein